MKNQYWKPAQTNRQRKNANARQRRIENLEYVEKFVHAPAALEAIARARNMRPQYKTFRQVWWQGIKGFLRSLWHRKQVA